MKNNENKSLKPYFGDVEQLPGLLAAEQSPVSACREQSLAPSHRPDNTNGNRKDNIS
jgi:hypothetical protein